ncbi:MAG: outer membrane protein assembly factor BamE [Burkholderiaceae bacterium]
MRTPAFLRFPLLTTAAAITAGLALGGCSSFSNEPATVKGFLAWIAPYKPDIVQGNVVTTEQISQIKPGMTRIQVRDILGTPLITDPFHAQRWDYVFTFKRQGFDEQKRAFVVVFDKDAVEKIDAPSLPSEDEFVASISRRKLPEKTPKLALTDAERAALPVPAPVASAASAAGPTGATRSYPPLEASAQ